MVGEVRSVKVVLAPQLGPFAFDSSIIEKVGGSRFCVVLRFRILWFRIVLCYGILRSCGALRPWILRLRCPEKFEYAGDDIRLSLLNVSDRFGGSVVDMDAAGAGDRAIPSGGNVLCDRAGDGVIHVTRAI